MSDSLFRRYTQKAVAVQAVQITEENMIEVAQNVGASLSVKYYDTPAAPSVTLKIERWPLDKSPVSATLGDWVILTDNEPIRVLHGEEFIQKHEPNDLHFVHDDYSK